MQGVKEQYMHGNRIATFVDRADIKSLDPADDPVLNKAIEEIFGYNDVWYSVWGSIGVPGCWLDEVTDNLGIDPESVDWVVIGVITIHADAVEYIVWFPENKVVVLRSIGWSG